MFACFLAPLYGQDTMQYESVNEGRMIDHFLKTGKIDSFEAFYYIHNTDSSSYFFNKHRLYEYADKLATLYPERKKEKVLKKIFEAIHKEFLIKYTDNVQFSEIFKSGTYNCVTSSALYALIFRRMDIPYLIKELTTHVYLTVLVEGKELDVETTLPQDLVQITRKQKTAYLEEMEKNKLVTRAEIEEKGVDKLFDEKYYQSKTICLRQLAGLSYYNYGILAADSDRYVQSLEILRISRNLYPRVGTNYIIGTILDQMGNNPTKYSFSQVVRCQIKYADLYDKEGLTKTLYSYALAVLFRDGDIQSFSGLDSYININVIRDYKKLKDVKYAYSKIVGEYYTKNSNYLEGIHHYRIAYGLFKTDVDSRYNLILCIRNMLTGLNDSSVQLKDTILYTLVNINELDMYEEYENIRYAMLFSVCEYNYQRIFSPGYALDKFKWNKFSEVADKAIDRPGIFAVKEILAVSFILSYACNAHQYKDTEKALKIVHDGLKKFPSNKYLLEAEKTNFLYAPNYYLRGAQY